MKLLFHNERYYSISVVFFVCPPILVRSLLCVLCSTWLRDGESSEDTSPSFIYTNTNEEFWSYCRLSTSLPYVGVVTPKVHRALFGDCSEFHQRVISTAMVSSSTALVVNPFEVLMLKVRTGVTNVNYLRGTVPLH